MKIHHQKIPTLVVCIAAAVLPYSRGNIGAVISIWRKKRATSVSPLATRLDDISA
jgi:hypothetical protein